MLKDYRRADRADELEVLERTRSEIAQERRTHLADLKACVVTVCNLLGLRTDQDYYVPFRTRRLPKLIESMIRKAERLRSATPPVVYTVKQAARTCAIAERLLFRKSAIEAEFLKRASDVNYQAIYLALQALEPDSPGQTCPACLTPLDRVVENPFKRAQHELQELSTLERLRQSKRRNEARIARLASVIATVAGGIKSNTQAGVPCEVPMDALNAALRNFHSATDRAEIGAGVLELFVIACKSHAVAIEEYLHACHVRHVEVAQAEVQATGLDSRANTLKLLHVTLEQLFKEKKALLCGFHG
ncbi:hypothetical protein C6381_25905, partial [Pseudomonas syringae pv. actinidiae]